jgi:ATP-dependent DNA ligase
VRLVAMFEDGEALYRVVCERGLPGVVAKHLRGRYRRGERGWVKAGNRQTPRFAEEAAGGGWRNHETTDRLSETEARSRRVDSASVTGVFDRCRTGASRR